MAKGFIDPPQEGDCVQWSDSLSPGRQGTQATQAGQGSIAHLTSATIDDDNTENGTISSASSQETLPPLSGSSMTSPQQSSRSPSQSSPVLTNPPHSPVLSSTSSPSLSSQLVASSLSLPQLPGPSLPPLSLPALSHPQSPPSPLYASDQPSITVEELHQQAIQDSANNNVDENSNNQQYDRYANYHQDYDQSVRPRVRMRAGAGGEEDEPDRAPSAWLQEVGPRGGGEGGGIRYSHRRNLSEGLPSTSLGYRRDSTPGYPPLPTYNSSPGHEHSLPPDLHSSSSREPPVGQEWDGRPKGGWSPSPSSWLPLRSLHMGRYGLSTSSSEDTSHTMQLAQELLVNFTTDELNRNHLQVPRDVMDQSGFSNPGWSRAGRELRKLADAFAETEERRLVRCMAEEVDICSMNMHNFFYLCGELFSDGITRERIVALFTFVGDVAVHQVRLRGGQVLQVLLNWSLEYLVTHVCRWVQDAGGWSVVLSRGANILYRTAVFAFCVFGSIAAGLFIYKTFKDW